MLLSRTSSATVVPKRAAISVRLSPRWTVYVTAPLSERVEIVQRRRGLTEAKAVKLIKKMQRNRELFYKRYSAGKRKLRQGKDLVINRALFGVEGCCEIIATAYELKMRELGRM